MIDRNGLMDTPMRLLFSLIAAACLYGVAIPAMALTETVETLASGARIRIAVPDGWTPGGGLVLYQHGFDMAFDDDPDLGPIRDRQLADGYAVAASGFRGTGWALFNSTQDNRDLLACFSARFGAPGRIITMGGSMGGLIAHKLAEQPGFEKVEGVYSLCPPAAGTRTWDTAFDLRMAYDAVCEDVGGGELPNGSAPDPARRSS
jgi:pimeloyl-ACP methyl ester carboxylesterase